MGKEGKKLRKQEVNTSAKPSPKAAFHRSLAHAPALAGKAMTDSSSKQEHPPELDFENFPPLTPLSGHSAPTEETLDATSLGDRRLATVEARLAVLEAALKEYKMLAFHCSKNDIILCAREILKRSINGRGEQGCDPRKFSLTMNVCSNVMRMSLPEYCELSHRCNDQRNSIAHFANIEDLELALAHSAQAIKLFPDFRSHLPDQCAVIDRFKYFKAAFRNNFI